MSSRAIFIRPDVDYPMEPYDLDLKTLKRDIMIEYINCIWKKMEEKEYALGDFRVLVDRLSKENKILKEEPAELKKIIANAAVKEKVLTDEIERLEKLEYESTSESSDLRPSRIELLQTIENLKVSNAELEKRLDTQLEICQTGEFRSRSTELIPKTPTEPEILLPKTDMYYGYEKVLHVEKRSVWTPREESLARIFIQITIPSPEGKILYSHLINEISSRVTIHKKHIYPLMKGILMRHPTGVKAKLEGVEFR